MRERERERAPVLCIPLECKSRLTADRARIAWQSLGKRMQAKRGSRLRAPIAWQSVGKRIAVPDVISLAARGCQDVISLAARGWPTGRGILYRFVTAARVNGLAEPGQAHPFVSDTQSVRRYFPNRSFG